MTNEICHSGSVSCDNRLLVRSLKLVGAGSDEALGYPLELIWAHSPGMCAAIKTDSATLHGKVSVGEVITCEAHIDEVTDLRYFWFADGYPLTWGPNNTYEVTTEDTGKTIRCMVKAVGAMNAPEAWSAALR